MRKKHIKYFLLLLFVSFLLPFRVLAMEGIQLEVDKEDLNIGDTITVTAKLTGEKKLYALTATLSYDRSVFEAIENDDFSSMDESLDVIYNAANNRFGMINESGEIPSELFTIRLKVKKDASVGDTNIALTNVSASDGDTKTSYDKTSVSVLVTRDAEEGEVIPNKENEEVKDQEETIISTFSTKPIIGVLVFATLVCGAITVYFLVRKRDKKKEIVIFAVATGALLVASSITFFSAQQKKDVNQDGETSYEDAKEIMKYLIDVEGTKKEEKPASDYDVNNDGKVDINDVGSSTKHTTKKVKYQAQLTQVETKNPFVNKGDITLSFEAKVTLDEKIKQVEIDGKYYPVTRNGSTYSVVLETPKTPGVHEYRITRVILSNNREVKTSLSIVREVLKEKPYVDMFNVNDEENTFNFNLEDVDNAFLGGTVVVTDTEHHKEVIHEEVKKENHFQYDFEKDIIYTVEVYADYDLDSGELESSTGINNLHQEELIYDHHFTINSDYDFKITDTAITDVVEKGGYPVISFISTNKEKYLVEYIVIDGVEYDVTSVGKDNNYEVALIGLDTSTFGRYHIDISGVVLDNLKEFELNKDYEMNSLTYNVLKNAPTVDNIHITNHEENKSVSVSYKVHDNDSTLEELTAVLVDSTDKVIDQQKVISGLNVVLSYKGNSDGRYKVKFLADYNLGTDRHDYADKNVGEEEILTQVDIYVESAVVPTPFPEKGQPKYTVTYKVYVSNAFRGNYSYNELAGVTINGLNYDGNKQSGEFTSAISFAVPNESGVIDLKVDRIKLRSETYQGVSQAFFSVAPHVIQIDVLKDIPKIEGLEVVEEDYEEGKVTFHFNVVTDKGGFETGEVELNGQKKPISEGENTITFTDVPKDENLDLTFYGTYDRDTNTLKDHEKSENYYTDEILTILPYGLYDNAKYDEVELKNVTATSKDNDSYFEKDEKIQLHFDLDLPTDFNFDVASIMVKDKEYAVEKKEDSYMSTVDGYLTSGVKTVEIKEIVLSNGRKISLKKPVTISFEVLKDVVTVEDFKYEVEDNISLKLALKDLDSSLVGGTKEAVKVVVFDEDGNQLEEIAYTNPMELPLQDDVLRYYLKVYATYDRDTNKSDHKNYYEDTLLLEEVISVDKNYIELKDINDITLYTEKDGKTVPVEEVDIEDLKANQKEYFVKISMEHLPTIYSEIKRVIDDSGRLVLVLDYEYVTKESEKERQDIRIDFGPIEGNIATNQARPETFEELIERIKNHPDGEFTLTHDLDASTLTTDGDVLIDIDFKGTLNGNGFTIKNLNKPLFRSITEGTVENLRFEKVTLTLSSQQGALANTANAATIRNVFINQVVKNSSNHDSGALIGKVTNHSTIENCRVTNLKLSTAWAIQRNGGLVGTIENSTIRNSYVAGSISANWNFIGAIAGNANNSEITNSYTKVAMSGAIACDFACSTGGGSTFKNNVSLSTGANNVFTNNAKVLENNYRLADASGASGKAGVTNIVKEEVTANLFKDLGFSEDIWNLKNVSYDNAPTFQAEKVSEINKDEVGDAYEEEKEMLYRNLMLLMPFYDSSKIVKSANNISANDLLATQEIKHIVPVDASGNVVTYLTSDNARKIKKIKIVFANGAKKEYDVRYDGIYDMVANYRISGLKIDYTFDHYVIDSNSQLVNNLTNYLASLTYEDNLDKLTATADSRLYREFYYDVTKKELKEFVLKYLSNSDYTNTNDNETINDYLEKEVKKDQKLEKILYVYNYLRRFYDLEIGGIKLYDLVLYDLGGFHEKMNAYDIALKFLSNDQNFKTNETNTAYNRVFSEYTGLEKITDFLEYLVKEFSNQTPADWYASQFKGYLVELKVEGREDIQYRLWDHIKSKDLNTGVTWYNYALPIATLPKNAAYIISTPVQFIIGAQRTYITNPDDPIQQAKFVKRVQSYAVRMKDYYATTAKLIPEAKYFNDIHTVQIDKRYAYDENGTLIFQNPETTQEPFHKNFNEVVGQFAYNDYNAATANGAYVIWRVEGVMDGNLLPEEGETFEYTYHTWSHESAHNIDARLFLKNNQRRFDAGGEDYADSNLMQYFGDGDIVMNLSRHFEKNANISSNLDFSRIDSPSKIQDFYGKLFDTIYILDYLEGKAFLTLTPEQQSKLVVQASYPNANLYEINDKPYYRNYMTTVYQTIDADKIAAMKLKTIDDLTKNQLVMYPTVIYSTIIDNRYGGENIYKVRWYQPHNDYGRPDSYSIKWLAYEMLGYAGYEKGYIEYYSNIHSTPKTFANVDKNGDYVYDDKGNKKTSTVNYKTDLMAIRTITNNQEMTIDKYKKMRFDEVEKKLEYVNVIDIDTVYKEFLEALKEDAETVRKAEATALERYPNSDQTSINNRNKIIAEARKFEKSTAVRRKYFYLLKNTTNDFIDPVCSQSKT